MYSVYSVSCLTLRTSHLMSQQQPQQPPPPTQNAIPLPIKDHFKTTFTHNQIVRTPKTNTQINSPIATTTARSFACNCKYLTIRCVLFPTLFWFFRYVTNRIAFSFLFLFLSVWLPRKWRKIILTLRFGTANSVWYFHRSLEIRTRILRFNSLYLSLFLFGSEVQLE